MRESSSILIAVLAGTIAVVAISDLQAETFILESGGRVRGEWLNQNESPREKFVIRTDFGGQITLARDQVAKIIYQSPDELLYEKLRPTYPDTVEGHEQLAEWCLEKRLISLRRDHLERIIELDPNHEEARTALGYRRVGGQWMTREEEMASRGLKFYAGRYRTAQEIEIWEKEKKARLAEREWYGKVKRWREWLGTSKHAQAVQNLKATRDPFAIEALTKHVVGEEPREVKLLFMEALANIPSGASLNVLVDRSLEDGDVEVRLTALDYVVAAKNPDAVTQYILALRSKNNVTVNRAAVALRSLGSKEAIRPLIDALVTEHKFKVVTGPPGQMSTSFRTDGGPGGGISFGGGGPKIFTRKLTNKDVLNALVVLTDGTNFDYDEKSWKNWYARQQRARSFDARRD